MKTSNIARKFVWLNYMVRYYKIGVQGNTSLPIINTYYDPLYCSDADSFTSAT